MKMLKLILALIISCPVLAQYPPAAGLPGSDAIHRDSSIISGWAINCIVNAGYVDISDSGSGYPDFGIPSDATGKAGEGKVVSLGDGGTAVVTFQHPVTNGTGPDFAIFENGFQSAFAPYNYFLELAFVEVSTDGERFVRFPSVSLTPDNEQISSYGQLDPCLIDGLAGKYVLNYGTPFDLDLLKDSSGIDIDSILFIRIIDVVGSINPLYANYDSQGNIINDPWPTAMYSSGFDLDAVGAIHFKSPSAIEEIMAKTSAIYPNPAVQGQMISFDSDFQLKEIAISDLSGKIILRQELNNKSFSTAGLSKGIYLITINPELENIVHKLIVY